MARSLTSLYQAYIQGEKLTRDRAQDTLVQQLEVFCQSYRHFYTTKPKKRALNFWRSASRSPQGIYLWGGVGRGKTTLLDLVLETLAPLPVKRIHTHLWLKELAQTPLSETERSGWAKDFRTQWPLLFLDEMEITHIADGMLLQRALSSLWNAGVVLLTTSNRPPYQLYPGGVQRELLFPFFAELEIRLQVLSLDTGQDHRQKKRHTKDLYFMPLQSDTMHHLTEWWNDITDHAVPLQRRLSFAGRFLDLKRTTPEVCWMTFEEACRDSLGLADYEAVLQTFPHLILSDIPQLTRQDKDAMRRLMVFVDLLYERRHLTVFSAAACPEDLVIDPIQRQEFARTASRLQEMRFWEIP